MPTKLTKRETEVALALAHGYTYDEIAAKRGIHRNSVYYTMQHLRKKLDAKNGYHVVAIIAVADYKRRKETEANALHLT